MPINRKVLAATAVSLIVAAAAAAGLDIPQDVQASLTVVLVFVAGWITTE